MLVHVCGAPVKKYKLRTHYLGLEKFDLFLHLPSSSVWPEAQAQHQTGGTSVYSTPYMFKQHIMIFFLQTIKNIFIHRAIIIIIINGTLARSLEPVVTECKEHTIHTQTQIVASRKPKEIKHTHEGEANFTT